MRARTVLTTAAAACLSLGAAGCSASTDEAAGASSSEASQSQDAPGRTSGGGPAGGGGGAGGGGLLSLDDVTLDTDGDSPGGANTAWVAAATQAFLDTLDDALREQVVHDFSDTTARQTWSNYPTQQVPREGASLADLSEAQVAAAVAMVDAALSGTGSQQDADIRTADDYLATLGEDQFGGLEDYSVAVYGTPSQTEPFEIQFGGHHLARNLTYDGDSVSQTPQFVGTEPTSFEYEGTTYAPLAPESSAVFGMLAGLDADQLAAAELSSSYNDLVMGPGEDSGEFPAAEGLPASQLSADQQSLVMDVVRAYAGDLDETAATALISRYQSELDRTTVSWAGGTAATDEDAYVRIDGPSVWIEFINTRSRSTPDIHFHSVYRDKTNDYGSSNPSA